MRLPACFARRRVALGGAEVKLVQSVSASQRPSPEPKTLSEVRVAVVEDWALPLPLRAMAKDA